MNKKTLKALEGSIEKWRDIVAGDGEDKGPRNCALCQLFLEMGAKTDCSDCPVGKAVDDLTVNCSPQYDAWSEHYLDDHGGKARRINCPECERLARAELKFLEGLRP